MPDPIFVEITDHDHAGVLNRRIGKIEAEEALSGKAKEFERLPGFGLALAILQRETAESRSTAMAENLRAVARAGIKVENTKQIQLETGPRGSLRLKVTMLDLADLAGEGA